jgi:hypothetical protein
MYWQSSPSASLLRPSTVSIFSSMMLMISLVYVSSTKVQQENEECVKRDYSGWVPVQR